MLWQALSILYYLFELKSEIGSKRSTINLTYFAAVCLVQTIAYFIYQQMYIVFLGSIILYALCIAISIGLLVFENSTPDVQSMRWFFFRWAFFSYAILGSSLWIIDMNFCDHLLPYYVSNGVGGMTFHILWHIGAGLGTYLTITFLVLVRLQMLKKEVHIEWIGRLIPVCRV